MKRTTILAVLVCPCLLGSCAKYQYLTMHSDLNKTPRGYIAEDDSVGITFSFAGENCPVQLSFENKSTRPLYIDWTRSALVVNKKAIPWNSQSSMTGTVSGYSQTIGDGTSINGDINGVITSPMSNSFVPPESNLENIPVHVATQEFNVGKAGRKKIIRSSSGISVTVRETEFSRDDSPFRLKTFLTLSRDPQMKEVRTVENEFWVGTLYQSDISLANCKCLGDPASTFYISNATEAGQVMAGTLLLVGAIGVMGFAQ